MRQTSAEAITKITNQLYLGGAYYMKRGVNTLHQQLLALGVDSVINVAVEVDNVAVVDGNNQQTTTMRYRKYDWHDTAMALFKSQSRGLMKGLLRVPQIDSYIVDAEKYLNYEINHGRTVYIHCYAGISRSVSLVIFHLMKRHRMTYQDALNHIKGRRYVQPNDYFEAQLLNYQTAIVIQQRRSQRRQQRRSQSLSVNQ